jgi:hypothetical protein
MPSRALLLITVTGMLVSLQAVAEDPTLTQIRHPKNVGFPPVKENQIKQYEACRTASEIKIDGRLSEPSWLAAEPSSPFIDLVSGKQTIFDTRVKLLWDNEYLYVGYHIQEPLVQAKFLERDQPIYQDNDVELFIAFDHAYYELEVNAHATLYEGLFVWQEAYEKKGFSQLPELNIQRPGVRYQKFNGVGYTKHPRGMRWAFLDWDFPDIQVAVHIDGTLNDDSDRDRGWTVELALPWKGMEMPAHGDNRTIPPRDGDIWRMDFSRFNQYREASPARDSGGWALSHHGIWDSHIPEVFAKVTFATRTVGQ